MSTTYKNPSLRRQTWVASGVGQLKYADYGNYRPIFSDDSHDFSCFPIQWAHFDLAICPKMGTKMP